MPIFGSRQKKQLCNSLWGKTLRFELNSMTCLKHEFLAGHLLHFVILLNHAQLVAGKHDGRAGNKTSIECLGFLSTLCRSFFAFMHPQFGHNLHCLTKQMIEAESIYYTPGDKHGYTKRRHI